MKLSKEKAKEISELESKFKKTNTCYHRGFTIARCGGGTYFTIINPTTKGHVHCKTVQIAWNICFYANRIRKFGCYRTSRRNTGNSVDESIMIRANRLALRPLTTKM